MQDKAKRHSDHNWANGSSLSRSLWDGGWSSPIAQMLSLRPWCLAEMCDFSEQWKVPTTDIWLLRRKQRQEVMEEILAAEEEERKAEESLTSNEIREMCKMWETVQNFVEKHHPNKTEAVWAINLFNDNALSISTKSSKGGKSKCHWIGSLLKLHEKKKTPLNQQIALIC